jgi:hypothetical protein
MTLPGLASFGGVYADALDGAGNAAQIRVMLECVGHG